MGAAGRSKAGMAEQAEVIIAVDVAIEGGARLHPAATLGRPPLRSCPTLLRACKAHVHGPSLNALHIRPP